MTRSDGVIDRAILIFLVSLFAVAAPGCALLAEPDARFSWEPAAEPRWPLDGPIVRTLQTSERHHGVDLGGTPGTPIVTALPGEVRQVDEVEGWDHVVVVGHGRGLVTTYAHLSDVRVGEGDELTTGESIGRLGDRRYLHFEVERGGSSIDPEAFVGVAPAPPPPGLTARLAERTAEPPGRPFRTAAPEAVATTPPSPETLSPLHAPPPPAPIEGPSPPVEAGEPSPGMLGSPDREARAHEKPTEPAPTLEAGTDAPGTLGEPAPKPRPMSSEDRHLALAIAASVGYLPAKLAYAGVGTAVGGVAWVLTGGNRMLAKEIWGPALGGDYVVRPEHVTGSAPLRFVGDPPPAMP